ncbi:cationic amino acid transporter 4-like [Centruroides vittatus]|uniref:cationic amino acid transporter 4-like n=1 Tax=Centruroides vittatus TaxID=120091 RepID=UPI003510963C
MSSFINTLCHRLRRTKASVAADPMETQLKRCLSTFDITLLAIGHMVGSGIYVLTASVSHKTAGPGIVVSFIISGIASLLAALCYAELGVRYPRAGSAYSYTYLAVGEFWAFIVGWNVSLENIIGLAAVSRACSAYIDSLTGGIIKNGTIGLVGTNHSSFLAESFDFLSPAILVVFVVFLSFGAKLTSYINNFFSMINMGVILVIICVGAYFSDIKNWTNKETGGFLPFGWEGVFAGSASCFYAFVGFDAIATAGEEAREPQKSIPIATFLAMGIATVAYVGVSSVLTLMISYKDITSDAGLADAFAVHNVPWVKIIVIVGALCGMATGLIGGLFALTRVVYSMAEDGLLFKFFSRVSKNTQIPLVAMYVFSFLSAMLSMLLDINTLVELLSIGTLMAYLVVSASVLILRYQPRKLIGIYSNESQELYSMGGGSSTPGSEEKLSPIDECGGQLKDRYFFLSRFFCFGLEPGTMVNICVVSLVALFLILGGLIKGLPTQIAAKEWWIILIMVVLSLMIIIVFFTIVIHEQSSVPLKYKVPFVPLLPVLSILCNAFLMTNLQLLTWVRLLVWVAIGLILYFSYGMRHSKLNTLIPTSNSSLLQPGTNITAYCAGQSTDSSYGTPATSARPSIEKLEEEMKSHN